MKFRRGDIVYCDLKLYKMLGKITRKYDYSSALYVSAIDSDFEATRKEYLVYENQIKGTVKKCNTLAEVNEKYPEFFI